MTRIFILWDSSHSVGNEAIDTQHQHFITILNELYESFVDQTTTHKLAEIFRELVDYAHYHFRTEEELFNKYDYPEKDSHIAKHREFIEKINEFEKNYIEGKINVTFQLMNYLRNWLLNHLKNEDQKYAAYLKAKNITT